MDVTTDLPTPARALAIAAHPDDIEFGAGATLAKWAAAGCELVHLVCTDGSKGSWDPADDPATLVASRQVEQRAASVALGGTGSVVFLGWRDGELESGLRQRADVCYWIRKLQPDVVLGHDPWKRYRLHPDHRHAGWLVCDAIVGARDPHFFPEHGIAHHRPTSLLLFEADEPDHVEDVAAHLDTKIKALLAHRSQLRSTMGIEDEADTAQVERFERWVRDKAAEHAEGTGVAYGERFKAIRDL